MKKISIILMIGIFMLLVGCVSQDEFRLTARRLDMKIMKLQEDFTGLQKSVHDFDQSSGFARKKQAEIDADIIEFRDEVQRLRGTVETLEKRTATFHASGSVNEELKKLKTELDNVNARMHYIEQSLDIVTRHDEMGSGGEGQEPTQGQAAKETDKEKVYSEAYQTFRDGQYKEAITKFQSFISAYPQTEYSDNAQFWIGECYYFSAQYEKAILEYEKVIQNYPKGNKVPSALLKQALSFQKLGDTSSAKLLLQRITKDFPGTTPAKIARTRLSNLQ